MGAAIISGLFAVVLACLAWVLKNGSRRARILSRIERYTRILKDLPDDHLARAHLDAALAADSEQFLSLTKLVPSTPEPPLLSEPRDTPRPLPDVMPRPADPAPIDWMGDEAPATPGSLPTDSAPRPSAAVADAGSPFGPPPTPPRALLAGHGSTVLWVLACLAAATTVGLVIGDVLAAQS